MRRTWMAALLVLAGMAVPASAQAETFTVNSTADTADPCTLASCTLRGAIIAANAAEGADVVALPAGTFALTLAGTGEDAAADGDLDVIESLTIAGAGIGASKVDGSAIAESVFDVDVSSEGGDGEAVFQDLEITGGDDSGSSDPSVIDSEARSLVLRRAAVTGSIGEQIVDASSEEDDGTVLFEDSRITGNEADDEIVDADADEAGTLIFRRSVVSDNVIEDGEAVIDHDPSDDAGTLVIEASTFERNTARGDVKGGPSNDGQVIDFNPSSSEDLAASVQISDSRFADNGLQVLDINPSANNETTLDARISRSVFENNISEQDGAAILYDPSTEVDGSGNLLITDSTFAGNEVDNFGNGGAIASDPSLADGSLDIVGSTFSGNSARSGGAIVVDDGDMSVTNSTFTGNVARAPDLQRPSGAVFPLAFGGAIAVFGSDVVAALTHVTIAGNRVEGIGIGGGIHTGSGQVDTVATGGSESRLLVTNSIVAGNTAGGEPNDCSESVPSEGNNIEGAQSCGFAGSGDSQNADPKLAALADNGGPTQTRAIGNDSPAFDTANSEFCEDTDQRGVTRPQFAGCDIGAFELASPPPPPPPPPPPAIAPAPAAQGGVLGASARSCVSRRRFSIRLRNRRQRVVKAVVRVNGKKVAVRRGRRLTSTVNLRGLPRGRFTVRITLTLAGGREISGTRTYRTCVPPRNDGRPPKV